MWIYTKLKNIFHKNNTSKWLFYLSLNLAFISGFSGGVFALSYYQYLNRDDIQIVPQNHDKIPLIHFEKIENGTMYGKTGEKEIRFIIGKESIFTSHGGNFDFSVAEILPMLKTLPAPDGSEFVASKRGSRYWALDEPEAFLLSEKNRIFFKNAQEAEDYGYKRGE
jgi:hypothetical protein